MLSIRRAQASDAEALWALHMASIRTLGACHYSAAQIEAWCGDRSPASYLAPIATRLVLLAEEDQVACGFGQLDPSAQVIEAVYVGPGAARKGVGSALLRHLELHALSLSVSQITLDASLNAQAFYAAQGYLSTERAVHELRPGVFLPCVRMRKNLQRRAGPEDSAGADP